MCSVICEERFFALSPEATLNISKVKKFNVYKLNFQCNLVIVPGTEQIHLKESPLFIKITWILKLKRVLSKLPFNHQKRKRNSTPLTPLFYPNRYDIHMESQLSYFFNSCFLFSRKPSSTLNLQFLSQVFTFQPPRSRWIPTLYKQHKFYHPSKSTSFSMVTTKS